MYEIDLLRNQQKQQQKLQGYVLFVVLLSSCEARDALMHAKRLTLSRLLLVHCTLRKRQMFFFCIRFVQL